MRGAVDSSVSRKVRNLGIVAALLVIVIHLDWPHSEPGLNWGAWCLVSEGLSRVAVPFFFVASGFFLAGHFGGMGWYRQEVVKRLRTLLVPFFSWSLLAALLCVPGASFGQVFGDGRWLEVLGLDPRAGPTWDWALWYLRALFVLVLLSPVLAWLVRRFGMLWLSVALLASLVVEMTEGLPLQRTLVYGLSANGLAYFSLGLWLRIRPGRGTSRRTALGCAAVGGAVLLVQAGWCLSRPDVLTHFRLYPLAVPFLLYAFWHFGPASDWPAWLTGASFPVYVVHMPIVHHVSKAVRRLPLPACVSTFVTWACVVVLAFVLIALMRRFLPRTFSWLFAGRV